MPLITAKVDSANKTVHLSDELELTGDVVADMNQVRARFNDGVGINPDGGSRIRLRDEDGD